jgi:large subunit ribosomal protein L10
MSKQIKQMEMDALKQTFQDVQDCLLLSVSGVNAQTDHQMRMGLRKKNIRLQVVKNSLARRVFDELGMKVADAWTSPTLVAWGAGSLAELSRELNALIKKNDKIKVKAALSERQTISFQKAIDMPTRAEAIGRIVGLTLSPASRLVSQMLAPGGRLAGQIKTIAERTPAAEETPAPAEETPAPS